MGPHMNEPVAGELTWTYRALSDEINSKTELRRNQDEKWTTEELIPPGQGIYPEAHLIRTRVRCDLERIVGP